MVDDRADEVADVSAEGLNPSNAIVDLTFDVPCLVRAGAVAATRLLPWIPDLVIDPDQYKLALAERLRTAGL